MNFEDMQKVWQGQPAGDAPTPEESAATLARVRTASRKFDGQIFWRDVREVAASLLVAVIFGRAAREAAASGQPAWPAAAAALLALGVGMYFLGTRWEARRLGAGRGGDMAAELRRGIAAVEYQARLLRRVAWWYLLPLGLSVGLMMLQYVLYAGDTAPWWARLLIASVMIGPMAWIYRWIYRLNQKAVREEMEPRLAELRAQLQALEDPADSG